MHWQRYFVSVVSLLTISVVSLLTIFVLASPVLAESESACVPVSSAIVAWWPFDENNGTIAQDIIGNNDGVYVNGPQQVQGLVGNALHFVNANQQYAGAPDSDLWAFGDKNFTIEFWANFDWNGGGTTSHPGDIFIGNDEGPFERNKWFVSLGQGFVNFVINSPTIGPQFFPYAPLRPTIGQWYHIAVTRAGNNYTIYINGTPSASALNNNFIPNPNAPLTIGQAEGLGYMHGSLDEMSIYHKALSEQELQAIVAAGPAGKCKSVRITTASLLEIQLNQPISFPFQAELGTPPYTWSIVSGTPPLGTQLSASGLLTGTPAQIGRFPIRVRVTDAQSNFAEKDITIDVLATLPQPNIRIYKTGTTAVPGRDIDYFVVAQNTGSTIVQNAKIIEFIEPWFTFIDSNPLPFNVSNFTDIFPVATPIPEEYEGYITWNLPQINPQESQILNYRVHLDRNFPVGGIVHGRACMTVEEAEKCRTDLAFCLGAVIPACFRQPPQCFLGGTLACEVIWAGCMYQAGSPFCDTHEQDSRTSLDPNEKEVLANRYIQSQQKLPYVIHYENIGTADAQDIVIIDDLQPEMNLSTVEVFVNSTFLPISNGQSIILFEKNQTKTINQTVGNQTFEFNISYFENHTVSLVNNRLQWELLHIHLDPNVTDQVLMAVTPNEGLANGTQVKNLASIVFDINPPIVTNETLNIIDDVRPQCTVNALPIETRNENITLQWSGSDALGEIDTYTILMSTNNGPFIPVVNATQATSATVETRGSDQYGFMCLARDTAGNSELQSPVAESHTYVNLATLNMTGIPQRGNTVSFQLLDHSLPNQPYIFLFALGDQPGISLEDGRVIPLNYDILFEISLVHAQAIGLTNSQSFLNSNGAATVSWAIPQESILANLSVTGGFVTLDFSRPFPGWITSISGPVTFTIQ